MPWLRLLALLALVAAACRGHAQSAATLNVICSVQDPWCALMSASFSRFSGIRLNVLKRGSGEALAQLIAEKSSPKADIWFGGTGDPHQQAAELGLTLEYKSPSLSQLYPWAQEQAQQSHWRTVGIYSGMLGFGYNTELLHKLKMPAPRCWKDLLAPQWKGEIQLANPNSSGTAYTMIAILTQLMGEDAAFDYLKALHKNVNQYTRSGTGPIKAVARGEATVSVSFLHDATAEAQQGFAVASVAPCEGTASEIGSMSIIKGARNLDNAKTFYEWALTPAAQQLGAAAKQFQLPSNKNTPLDSRIPDFERVKFIRYDYAKYGSTAERKRLIARWQRDIDALAQ